MDELERINQAVDEFAVAIKARLKEKYEQLYSGWEKDYPIENIKSEMSNDITFLFKPRTGISKIRAVDIAARAMMIYKRAIR